MKKKALLVLLPALAMALAGCNGSSSADDDEETSEQGGGAVLPEGVTEADFGTLSAPVTIANAKALLDKLDPNKGGDTFAGYRLYVKGIVSANAEYSSQYGNYSYAYIADETAGDFSINKFIVASGVSGDWTAKNSMKGKEVVASGYACIYTDKNGNHKYEITSLADAEKDEDRAQVHSITEPPKPTDVNYGTLENPLSVSQAIAEINKFPAKTTDQPLYVTGTVESNTAYDTEYKNLDIVITDGQNDFTLFRVSAIPGMTIADVGENGLVGASVVAHAISTYYSQASKYETNANPTLDVFSLPASDIEFSTQSINLNTQSPAEDLDLSQYVNFLPAGAQPVEVVYAIVTEGSPVTINSETGVLDLTQVESDGSVVVSVTIEGTAKTATMTVNYAVAQAGQITSFALSSQAEEFFYNGSEEQKRADINITDVMPLEGRTEEFAVAEVKNTGTEQAPVWSAVASEEAKVDVELNSTQDCVSVALKSSVEAEGSTLVRVYPKEHIENGKNIVISIAEYVNYGTLEDPLTTSEAKALIDAGKTSQDMYVAGSVKTNEAWYSKNTSSNITITITDGVADLIIFRTTALPGYTAEQAKAIVADQLVGANIVAHGTGTLYQSTKYELTPVTVDSLEFPEISELSWRSGGNFEVGPGDTLDLANKVVQTGFGDITYELAQDEVLPDGVTFDTANGVLVIPSSVESAVIHVIAKAVVGATVSDPCTITISNVATNYGTAESPLGVADALEIIDAQVSQDNEPTYQPLFVTGIVTENTAWSTQFSNIDITIKDANDDTKVMKLYRAVGSAVEGAAANDLVGSTVVATGSGLTYKSAYQLGQGCSVISLVEPPISALAFGAASYDKVISGSAAATFDAASKLTVTGKTGTLVWSIIDSEGDNKVTIDQDGLVAIAADTTERSVTVKVELDGDSSINASFDLNITIDEGGGGEAQTVTDVLNNTLTGISGTSYTDWSNKTSNSSAVYAGQSAGGNSSIQLRSKNSNSGVITTASGGKIKSITIAWNSGTTAGRTVDIYGNNEAYTAPTQLYGTPVGTKLGSIVCGTSTVLEVEGDYTYFGLRSSDGALYIDSITVVWEAA